MVMIKFTSHVFHCLNTNQWVTGEGSVVRQRESDLFVRACLPSYRHTKGMEFNILYHLIVLYCQENK